MKKIIGKNIIRGKNINIGKHSSIIGNNISIGNNVIINDDVTIIAEKIIIGDGVEIRNDVILGLNKIDTDTEVYLGDQVLLYPHIRGQIPQLRIGDYSVIHEQTKFYGPKSCTIGHNSWVGQLSIFNTRERLTVGNSFRSGPYNQLWTHNASGELIEGSTLYLEAPTIIEDNVWLCGSFISINPGLKISDGTVVLPGSIVTKSTKKKHIYGGIPAKDITDKVKPYIEISKEEKFRLLEKWVNDFIIIHPDYQNKIHVIRDGDLSKININNDCVVFTDFIPNINQLNNDITLFDIISKKYIKRRNKIEVDIVKYLIGHKARFLPLGDENIGL